MNTFPVDKLQNKTQLGFQLKAFYPEDNGHYQTEDLGAHRDDHYIFFLVTKGTGTMMVDFEQKSVKQNQLYYILPEQVHYKIKSNKAFVRQVY